MWPSTRSSWSQAGHEEAMQPPERKLCRSRQHAQLDEVVEIGADRRVDAGLGEIRGPVRVEGAPVGGPHRFGHLEGGAQPGAQAIESVGGRLVHRAVHALVQIQGSPVQAGRDPQLQRGVEGVVVHRAGGRRVDLAMRYVDRLAVGRAFLVGAEHRHGQVGKRGAQPFDRMQHHIPAVDPALQDAIADRWSTQLHDDVRDAAEEAGYAVEILPDVEGVTRLGAMR
jgi:hypothetical protein